MIPDSTVIAFIVSAIFTLLLPIVLLIVLGVRRRISGLPLLIGAVAFFLSQIVLRIPLINTLSTQSWYQNFSEHFFLYAFVLSLSAGLFEESARFGGAALLKKHRSFKDAVSFGLGHAFCEVIILVGIMHISNIALCFLINSGNEAAAAALSADAIQNATDALMALNPADIYWGVVERFSAVLFHVFATVLVFRGVREKKVRYYLLAIAAHMLFNLSGVLFARYTRVAVTEIVLLILAFAAGFYVVKQRNSFGSADDLGGGSYEKL